MRTKSCTGLAVAMVICLASGPGNAVPYSLPGTSQTAIGDNIGSDFDQIFLSAFSGDIAGAGTYILSNVEFVAGPNSNFDEIVPGSLSELFTLGSDTATLNIPFSLSVSSTDILTIFGGTTILFPGYKVVLNQLVLSSGGGSQFGDLTAEISEVPLPAALPLFASGAGVLGLFGWRKRRKATTAA